MDASLEEDGKGKKSRSRSHRDYPESTSKDTKADRSRSTQFYVHDPGGRSNYQSPDLSRVSGESASVYLPTTVELAKSFLQAEPKEEKVQIQAALSRSHHLDQSSITTEDVDEDSESSGLGVANTPSLPWFLADFLKGVVDRIQLKVYDVEIDLHLQVAPPSDGSASNDATDRSEDVTIRISVEEVALHAATSSRTIPTKLPKVQQASGFDLQDIRRIALSNVQVMLMSEASIFSNFARSAAPSSPETIYANAVPQSGGKRGESSLSSNGAESKASNSAADVNSGMYAPLDTKSAIIDSGRGEMADIENDDENNNMSTSVYHYSASNSEYHQISLADSSYSTGRDCQTDGMDSANSDSQLDSSTCGKVDNGRISSLVLESSYRQVNENLVRGGDHLTKFGVSTIPPKSSESDAQLGFPSPSEPSTSGPSRYAHNAWSSVDVTMAALHSKSLSQGSEPILSPIEDLAQSKMFSHEDAESVYMSAISHAFDRAEDNMTSMPGDWNFSSSGSGHEFEERILSGECSKSEDHNNYSSRQLPVPSGRLGLASFCDDRANTRPRTLRPPATEHKHVSPSASRPATDLPLDPEIPSQLPDQRTASSSDSEIFPAKLKGPLTLVKRILIVDTVLLTLRQGNSSGAIASHQTKSGTLAPINPPLFEAIIQAGPSPSTQEDDKSPLVDGLSESQQHNRMSTIEIGTIQVVGDMALAKLSVIICEQYTVILQSYFSRKTGKVASQPPQKAESGLRLTAKRISWKFFDLVKGVPLVGTPHENSRMDPRNFSGSPEVLLRADIRNLSVLHRKIGPSLATQSSVGKFSFGYATEDIVSFDSGLKIRESIRDVLPPVGNDMILVVTKSTDAVKIDLTTLPLHIALDLRRLDETFGWFGGFSSMLGLGSSMMSNVTATSKSPHLGKPARGVHFEGPLPEGTARSHSNLARNKVTARIGGLSLDVRGAQCSLRLESTAMKLVSRAEGLGFQIDRLKISGPSPRQVTPDPSTMLNFFNVRIEYLSMPKEVDLARLLALLSPSKEKYESDDDILLDTLLRQRRQGGVLRVTVENLEGDFLDFNDLRCFATLAKDLKKLSTVTEYLPEDDRPGILTLGLIRGLKLRSVVNESFGTALLGCKNVEVAHVTFPSLITLGITSLHLHRNQVEELVGDALPLGINDGSNLPMVMARFIGNEMEPTVKIKINNIRLEYDVATLIAVMAIHDDTGADSIVADVASSVAGLANQIPVKEFSAKLSGQGTVRSDLNSGSKALNLDVVIRDSLVGLNPRYIPARGLLVLTDTHFVGVMPREGEANATLEIKKASIMVIDNADHVTDVTEAPEHDNYNARRSQVETLSIMGYVSVGLISAARFTLRVVRLDGDSTQSIDVEVKDDLFVLESCADSTQTLQNVLNGLTPPTAPSTEQRYRTEVVPVEDMLASFSGDAFPTENCRDKADDDVPLGLDEGDMVDDEVPQNEEFLSNFYNPDPGAYEGMLDSMLEEELDSVVSRPRVQDIGDKNLLDDGQEQAQFAPDNTPLDFQDDHFGASSVVRGTAHRWDNKQNTYGVTNDPRLRSSPLRVRVRDVHIIWNLFDGYDWQDTRDTISQAVEDVEIKATERLARKDRRKSLDKEEEEESVIGDFLFNSIYIGIPGNRDPKDLTRQVNRNLNDLTSETESYATSSSSGSPSRQSYSSRAKGSKRLRLKRSKYHKMTFELKGISADVVIFPPNTGETQSSVDIRIQDLEIFDHVPSSTWKKFATYMHDAGERESGTSMIHLEIINVKPVPNLAASEILLKVGNQLQCKSKLICDQATILPLRLHIDQDALDFMTRFFEFKNNSLPSQTSTSDTPFLQRVEVNSVRVKLDFKPKRVDYAGIRSGHTNEFMNFFILDRADMILRHVIIYGVSGFDRLGKTLNDIWMPDVKRNQLPGILAGLAPVRSLVNVGGGVRDLVVVPIREYQKDGRMVRSLQKGAVAFAKTTTGELIKLGAKLAIGTQTVLQGAEDLLGQAPKRSDMNSGWEDGGLDEEEKKQISLYADQPLGVVQGLRGAYASLERDLLTAKDAIVAIPGEVMESGTAGGAAKAVLRSAPTIILRPAMGVSKAVGQTLMGATNSLDPGNRRRVEEVSVIIYIIPGLADRCVEVQETLTIGALMNQTRTA